MRKSCAQAVQSNRKSLRTSSRFVHYTTSAPHSMGKTPGFIPTNPGSTTHGFAQLKTNNNSVAVWVFPTIHSPNNNDNN